MVKEYNGENFEELIKNGKFFFDFYADWCYPCQMMMPVVDEISDEKNDVTFYKVNVDNYSDLAVKFKINTIPRFMMFKDGEFKNQIIGGMDKEDLDKAIDECLM